jgi:DNA replicative helicase MCM subunit Mcm2 (Cdc46/Mcm family)
MKPTITLAEPKPKQELLDRKIEAQPQTVAKKELWSPWTIQTKGLSQALKWLMENLPEKAVSISEIVEQAYEETGIEKPAIETAIWRLTQQGITYQPEPGKIRKL